MCRHVARSMHGKSRWVEEDEFFQEGCLAILKHWNGDTQTKAWVRSTLRYSLSRFVYNQLGPLQYHHRPAKLRELSYTRQSRLSWDEGNQIDVRWDRATEDKDANVASDACSTLVVHETEQAVKRVLGSSTIGFQAVTEAIMEGTSISEFARTQGLQWKDARCILRGVATALRSDERFMAVLTEL